MKLSRNKLLPIEFDGNKEERVPCTPVPEADANHNGSTEQPKLTLAPARTLKTQHVCQDLPKSDTMCVPIQLQKSTWIS